MAVGGPLLGAYALPISDDLGQFVDAPLRLLRFSFQALVVLQVILKCHCVNRPGIEEIVEDELADQPDRLEGERLHDQSMKGLRPDAKPLSDLFPIRAGILPVLRAVAAQPDAKITQRPDNALARSMARGRDRLHIGYAKAGRHEEHL